MVIFRRTRGPVGDAVSGGRGPAIPSPLRNKEAGKVKININLIKIIAGLNKIKEKIKTLREIISFFTRSF